MRFRKARAQQPLAFEAYGVGVQVTPGDEELRETVRTILPPGARECTPDASTGRFEIRQARADEFQVTVGETTLTSGAALDVALGLLDQQMRLYIAATARDWIFVHAGTVAVDDRAIVVPGPSFSGKTSIVAALVQAGATYFSDEYAVIDPEGRVHPYPRRLSVRSADGTKSAQRHVSELGGVAGDRAADVALVAAVRYRAGAAWKVEPISAGQGIAALLANTVPAHDRPQECLRALKRVVTGARVIEGERGEAGPTAEVLLKELDQSVSGLR